MISPVQKTTSHANNKGLSAMMASEYILIDISYSAAAPTDCSRISFGISHQLSIFVQQQSRAEESQTTSTAESPERCARGPVTGAPARRPRSAARLRLGDRSPNLLPYLNPQINGAQRSGLSAVLVVCDSSARDCCWTKIESWWFIPNLIRERLVGTAAD